jgi:hypothetical protein
MLERFKRSRSHAEPARDTGAVATAERPEAATTTTDPAAREDRGIRRESEPAGDRTIAENRTTTDDRTMTDDTTMTDDRTLADDRPRRPLARTGNGTTTRTTGPATASALEAARVRQRDEFGGINWGASFFGWLVAVGVATLLVALLAAAGAAVGLTESDVTNNTEEIGLGGGIALVIVLMIAYYAGGYVAGRMSRFDGGRQGIGTWLIGLIVTVALAAAAVILGDQYNVLEQLNLPSLPVGDETLATGGIIALAAIALGSLLAAMLGGKLGERYHRRIDRAGFVD